MSLPPPAPDSIALVTGASSGIGEQYARQLSERGHRVAIVARREDRLVRLAEELGGQERGAVINMSSTAGFQPLPFNAGYSAAKAYLLYLSEALHAEVKEHGVTVTVVAPGPVPSGFQDASDANYFAERLPKFTFVSPERVARDALAAADRGRISVIPGPPHVKAALAPNRRLPRWLVLPISKRMTARG
jgi:uncharacterized protein